MKKTRKIRAYLNGTNFGLGNFIFDREKGYNGSAEKFVNTINNLPFDGAKICIALNKSPEALFKFKLKKQTADTIIIKAIDNLGTKIDIVINK